MTCEQSKRILPALTLEHRPARQNGMALVIVLWLVVLLGIMAAGHASNVHSESTLASRHIESAKARTLAEAGIQRAIISLLLQDGSSEQPVNGTLRRIDIDGREVSIAIRDATGLVDLNAADAGLLAALLTTAVGDPLHDERLVDAILDWRDPDNFTHLHGAEDAEYSAAGLAWTARDAAFSSVDELRYVIGMTPERFTAIAPYVTVYSGQSRLNLEYAPPILIRALSGQTVDTAGSDDATPSTSRHEQDRARNGTYHVYASATGNGNVSASVEAVVNIAAAAEQPYIVLYWREPARFTFREED
jgi:general secretion pathway protein K